MKDMSSRRLARNSVVISVVRLSIIKCSSPGPGDEGEIKFRPHPGFVPSAGRDARLSGRREAGYGLFGLFLFASAQPRFGELILVFGADGLALFLVDFAVFVLV